MMIINLSHRQITSNFLVYNLQLHHTYNFQLAMVIMFAMVMVVRVVVVVVVVVVNMVDRTGQDGTRRAKLTFKLVTDSFHIS